MKPVRVVQTIEEQIRLWVSGESTHRATGREPPDDYECCPDFSCCTPHLLQPADVRAAFAASAEPERHAMLSGFLTALLRGAPARLTAREDVVARRAGGNLRRLIERGPRLSHDTETWVVARDRARRRVLLGGLGAMGCGQMWFDERPEHAADPTFADAPEQSEGAA